MNENVENNIENQEVSEEIEDRRAKLQLWTTEKYKEEFKKFEGTTDNEKLINILEIANKYKDKVDNFSIKSDVDIIERAFKSISTKLANIQDSVNMYEEDLVKSSMEQLIEIKNSIIKEEVLNSKIIQIEKERDTFEERLKKEENILYSCQNRIKELEESNRSLTQKNSDLVHSESENTKLLVEKEAQINNINKENDKYLKDLNLIYDNNLKEKDGKIKEIEDKLKKQENEHKEEIVNKDKEKIGLLGQIDKYKNLLEVSNTDLEAKKQELEETRTKQQTDMENIRQKHLNEIEKLRNTHKIDLQEIRDNSAIEKTELQEAYKKEIKELRNNNETERKELLEVHKAELKELRESNETEKKELLETHKKELDIVKLKEQEANNKQVKTQSKLEMKDEKIEELKEELKNIKDKEDTYKNKIDDLETENNTLKEYIAKLQKELKELSNIKDQLEKDNKR